MAALFCRESLDRIVEESQAERLKFQNKRSATVDMFSASTLVNAIKQVEITKPQLADDLLRHSAKSPESFSNVLSLIWKHS